MLESPKKNWEGGVYPLAICLGLPFFNIMLMRSRLIMMLLSRMMKTHFANAVGLEKAGKRFPRSLRKKKLSN